MPQYDDSTKMLMDIREDVAATKQKVEDIKDKLDHVDEIDGKADKALSKSIEVEHEVGRVTQSKLGNRCFSEWHCCFHSCVYCREVFVIADTKVL